MKTLLLSLSLFLMVPHRGSATIYYSDVPYVISARGGSTRFFMMLPGNDSRKPLGRCYEVGDNGELRILWTVRGWYSCMSRLFLTDDGNGLVRVREISTQEHKDERLLGEQVYLEFYQRGTLVESVPLKSVVDVARIQVDSFYPSAYQIEDRYGRGNEPKLVQVVNEEVAEEQVPKIMRNLKSDDVIFVLNTAQHERIFFNVSNGHMLYRVNTKSASEK